VYGTLQLQARESVWTYLGNASYSLYLTHIFTLNVLLVLWRIYPIQPDLIILIGISVSVLFAWRIHERFEKPIMILSKTYLGPEFLRRLKPLLQRQGSPEAR
jgi:exopolysaccharide production protein ExoZ